VLVVLCILLHYLRHPVKRLLHRISYLVTCLPRHLFYRTDTWSGDADRGCIIGRVSTCCITTCWTNLMMMPAAPSARHTCHELYVALLLLHIQSQTHHAAGHVHFIILRASTLSCRTLCCITMCLLLCSFSVVTCFVFFTHISCKIRGYNFILYCDCRTMGWGLQPNGRWWWLLSLL